MVSKESHKQPGLLFNWILFGFLLIVWSIITYFQPSLLPEYGFVAWIAIAWWVLPLTFVYLIPAYVRYNRGKRKEKRRREIDKLVRSFEHSKGVIPLDVEALGTRCKVKAELIYQDVYDTNSGKNVKCVLHMSMDHQTYVSISLSYNGKRKEVSVRNSQELKEDAKYFVSTVLKERKDEREKNDQAEELLHQLTQDGSLPARTRKASSRKKVGRKSRSRKAFLTSKDKLRAAEKNLGYSQYPEAVQNVCSSFEKWLREVLSIDDTKDVKAQNLVEQWKKHNLSHVDEVEEMAEALSLSIAVRHPLLYNPSAHQATKLVGKMRNLIELKITVPDKEKQDIKSSLHI